MASPPKKPQIPEGSKNRLDGVFEYIDNEYRIKSSLPVNISKILKEIRKKHNITTAVLKSENNINDTNFNYLEKIYHDKEHEYSRVGKADIDTIIKLSKYLVMLKTHIRILK